jgi:Prealbumin-like fold domain
MAAFRFRQRQTRRWWYAGAVLAAAAFFTVFFVVGAGATLSGSPSGFESGDGNMVLNNTDGSHTDWNCFVGSDHFQSGTPNTNCKVNTGALNEVDPNAGTANDVSWVSGQKMDLQCAKTTTGNNPAKDTFNNIAQYNETDASRNLWLYGASIRATANGSANENVELSQNPGTTACPINRTQGDKLLLINFSGNAIQPVQILTFYTTLPTGVSCFNTATHHAPCWASSQTATTGFEGAVDSLGISGANNGMTGNDLVAGLFAEFGVNLSSVLGLPTNSCTTFGQETWESKSSPSFSANPEDIEIVPHTLTNCGSLLVYKTAGVGGSAQSGAVFTASPGTTDSSGVTATSSTFVDEGNGYYCLDNMLLNQTGTIHEVSAPAGYNTAADQGYTVTNTASCADRLAATTITPDNTFADIPQTGALKIVKTAKNKSCTGAGTPTISSGTCKQAGVQYLSGVSFGIYQSNVQVGSSQSTDANGVACFTNLNLGTYNVRETAPSNYQGASNHDVTVTVSSTPDSCSTGTPTVDNVSNTPKSKIEVLFTSSAGSGVTAATITCKDASNNTITPDSGSTSGTDQSYSGLLPNPDTSHNYTCTINIDP